MQSTILVTGGAGFIGSHLSEKLAELGNEVTILDNLSITDRNIPLLEKKGIKKIIGDVSDSKFILSKVKNFDIVFHLAAMNRAIKSIRDPLKANMINITGTLNVLEACRKNDIKKMINISSSSIYGNSKIFPRKEENEVKPSHPYGVGKLAGENYANVYHDLYNIDTANIRYFSIYGPRQLGTIELAGVIPKFIHNISNDREIEVYGNGEQKRNFTYVKDAVEAAIKVAEIKEAIGETFNISCQEEISINNLIKEIEMVLQRETVIKHINEVKGEIKTNPADVSKAKRILNFEASTLLREGLTKTIEWYKNES